jgi:hypothetical protein
MNLKPKPNSLSPRSYMALWDPKSKKIETQFRRLYTFNLTLLQINGFENRHERRECAFAGAVTTLFNVHEFWLVMPYRLVDSYYSQGQTVIKHSSWTANMALRSFQLLVTTNHHDATSKKTLTL